MSSKLNSLVIFSSLIVPLPFSQALAGCIDDGIAAFAASPRVVELCYSDGCEIARFTRQCGNIHYASEDYETDSDQWLFRVRYHDDGTEDDEFTLFLNGTELSTATTQLVACIPMSDRDSCEFINYFLHNAQCTSGVGVGSKRT